MASHVTALASALWAIVTVFGVSIVVSGLVALVIARKWGRSKRSREAICSVIGFIGLAISAFVAQYRLRHIG